MGENPAILELVVQHDRVAGGIGAVGHGEAGPQHPGVHRSEQQCPRLRVDGEDQVHYLDVVVRPDIAVGVGRVYPETEDVEIVLIR